MIRYNDNDIPAHLPESDKRLILEANELRWEYINEDLAETQEARDILHDIASTKYHLAEFKAGMD